MYRHEVRCAAIEALVEAIGKFVDGGGVREPLDPNDQAVSAELARR